MRKLILALMLTLMIVLVMAGPALAAPRYDGQPGVSATGLGRCNMDTMGPGTGAAVAIWVPGAAFDHRNGGNSGLVFVTPP
jgi:hypothetical protein